MKNDTDTMALLLYTATHQSRRLAKRLIRDAGGHGSAEEHDALLAALEASSQRAEIHQQAENLHRADLARQADTERPGENHPLRRCPMLMTVGEFADHCGLEPGAIRMRIARGLLRTTKKYGRVLIDSRQGESQRGVKAGRPRKPASPARSPSSPAACRLDPPRRTAIRHRGEFP